jgi:hypothetical protein
MNNLILAMIERVVILTTLLLYDISCATLNRYVGLTLFIILSLLVSYN